MQNSQFSLQKARTIGNYVITKNLGEGTFGKVKLGLHSVTGQKVAIKILEKSKITDVADVQRVTRQIHILKAIRHPNLIQLYEIIETPKQLFLIMEFSSEGELFEHIVKKKKLKESEACEFFRQIIQGVQYMHQLGIVHRDLKPENLLIDFNQRLKIVDFGLSNTYKKKELLKTACGSPCYAAPEMIAGKKYEGLAADIWSCGVILFAMICGYLPFEDSNTALLYKKITSGQYSIPKFVSPFGRELLQRLLTTDPEKRIKISEIKRHAWYRQPVELEFNVAHGVKVGIDCIPIDPQVLKQVAQIEGNTNGSEHIRKLILNNRHNHTVTLYYLILKKNLRNGKFSSFDISSPNFDPLQLTNNSTSLESVNGQKNNEDLEEISLDRVTTAFGHRKLRAFSKNNSNRATNCSDSPDITAHNFYVNKSKDKRKSTVLHHQQDESTDLTCANIDNSLDFTANQPSANRRKIYFQAPTKTILTNSIDIKTIKPSHNGEIKTQRFFEKSSNRARGQERNYLNLSTPQEFDEKRETLNKFFHQERKNVQSIRKPVSFRTSMNRSKLMNQNKLPENQLSFRQSLQSRDAYDRKRYLSLDTNEEKGKERKKYNEMNMNTIDQMNRTFMANTKNKVARLFELKVDQGSQKMRSLMTSTMTTGFHKRRATSRQNDPGDIVKFNY